EGYSTGISQPLNSTIFAPILRWTAFKAVLAGVAVRTDKKTSIVSAGLVCRIRTYYPNTGERGVQPRLPTALSRNKFERYSSKLWLRHPKQKNAACNVKC